MKDITATIEVSDISKSIEFYTSSFGMNTLSSTNSDEVILGYGSNPSSKIRLINSSNNIILGTGFRGIGLNVEDADDVFLKAEVSGKCVCVYVCMCVVMIYDDDDDDDDDL